MPSRAKQIGDAAVAAIDALALSGAPAAVLRRRPSLPAGTEPPQIVVAVRKRAAVEYLTAQENLHAYDGVAAVIGAGGETLGHDDAPHEWLAAIAAALDDPDTWAGVTGFNDAAVGDVEAFDRAAGGKTLAYHQIRFRVETLEPKT